MSNPVLILYLEDDPRDAELVRDKLQQAFMACELRVASDRAEYEAALAQTRFDLILSDYKLPNYDGMAALALARAQQPDVPFILISGTLGEEAAVDCALRGATDSCSSNGSTGWSRPCCAPWPKRRSAASGGRRRNRCALRSFSIAGSSRLPRTAF